MGLGDGKKGVGAGSGLGLGTGAGGAVGTAGGAVGTAGGAVGAGAGAGADAEILYNLIFKFSYSLITNNIFKFRSTNKP